MAVGVAGLAGRLPRNRWVGVRTPDTLRDDAAFRLANKVAGPTMLAGGAILLAGAVAALTFPTIPGVVAAVLAVVGTIVVAGIGSALATKAAVPAPAGACGNSCGGCSLKDSCQPS